MGSACFRMVAVYSRPYCPEFSHGMLFRHKYLEAQCYEEKKARALTVMGKRIKTLGHCGNQDTKRAYPTKKKLQNL